MPFPPRTPRIHTPHWLFGASLALALAGCGGSTEDDRPSRTPDTQLSAIDECAAQEQRVADGWEFQPIVDFEPAAGGNPSLKPVAECEPETPCGFYFNYDALYSPTGAANAACDLPAVQLNQSTGPAPVREIPGRRCGGSSFAYHLVGTNIATCTNPNTGRLGWGATLAITFDARPENSGQSNFPLDASEWDGLSFWVRVGSQPSGGAVLASVMDPFTATPPYYDGESPYGNYCLTADGTPDAKKCDPFGLAVLLRPEWRFVKVPFSLVQQKGFGMPSPTGKLDTSVLVGLQFVLSAGNWDFWLDDLSLYREP